MAESLLNAFELAIDILVEPKIYQVFESYSSKKV